MKFSHKAQPESSPLLLQRYWLECDQHNHLVTQLYKSLKVIYKSQHEAMTDYSAAIYGLIAFASVITAGVVYVLAQPTDVPVAQKTRS